MTSPDPEKTEELQAHLDRAKNSAIIDFGYVLDLIDEGADVNTFDSRRHWSPLLLSLYEDKPRYFDELLKRGVDIEARDKYGHSALFHAAMAYHDWGYKRLIEKGANIHAVDDNGWTPLHFAANHQKLGMVRLLLEGGADPDAQTSLGATALELAGDADFRKGIEEIQRHVSLRHANRVRALRRHSHRKRALKL